jgi:hypothetical protein
MEEVSMEEEVKSPEAVLAELRRAQEDLKALRLENKTLKSDAETNDSDAWKKRAVKAEAKVALANQGLKDTDRVLKHINLDNVDFDEEGNLKGLDESLETFKSDFPELFDVKKKVGGKADIFADDAAQKTVSASELQARQLLG